MKLRLCSSFMGEVTRSPPPLVQNLECVESLELGKYFLGSAFFRQNHGDRAVDLSPDQLGTVVGLELPVKSHCSHSNELLGQSSANE